MSFRCCECQLIKHCTPILATNDGIGQALRWLCDICYDEIQKKPLTPAKPPAPPDFNTIMIVPGTHTSKSPGPGKCPDCGVDILYGCMHFCPAYTP